MLDAQKLSDKKERIISLIRVSGPSLPVHVSKGISENSLFTAAFLSELYNDRKLKMSNLKVGSSYLYYLAGQEDKLENFIQFLNMREREAFELLKNGRVLEDEEVGPIMRIALRAIKDFAVPVQIQEDDKTRLFWKYYSVNEEEFKKKVQEITHDKWSDADKSKKKVEKVKVEEKAVQEREVKVQEIVEATKVNDNIAKMGENMVKVLKKAEVTKVEKANVSKEEKLEGAVEKEVKVEIVEKPKKIRAKRKAGQPDTKFADFVKEYLAAKEVEVLQDLLIKKKDYTARVRLDSLFGKQEYYLVAKDKKKIVEEDLLVALQKAQALKMPALVIAKGSLDKEAEESIKEWKNLVKFEKIK